MTADSAVLRVTGDMKVGQFSITFEDVSIPLAGIPVRVTRTYDSRQRNEDLDFGRGWSIENYQNVRVRESQKAGFSWRNYQPLPGPFGQWCTKSNGNRVVTVTLPDGQVESFRAKAVPECTPLKAETNVHLEFEAIDGTDSTLAQSDFGLLKLVTVAGTDVYNLVDPELVTTPVDPRHYQLTTPEGVVYSPRPVPRHREDRRTERQHDHIRARRHPPLERRGRDVRARDPRAGPRRAR